jgi:hypothetical protein
MPKTASNVIKLENHALRSNDGIVNISKGNLFRVIVVIDENTITHEFAVKDQAAGDTILKLARLGSGYTQAGTNETILKIKRHGLSAGDWIRNDTRGWEARRVKRVLDENTIEVDPIMGQSAGDEIDLYKNTGSGIAK